MSVLVNSAYTLAGALFGPVLCYRAATQGKYRRGWSQRRGFVDPPPGEGPLLWIHAVSVGEINATRTLVDQIGNRLADCRLTFSTTTDTGQERAKKLYGPERVFYFPLDFSWMARRALKRVRPAVVVLMELEVWYHHVHEAARMDIPVAVANGRITERSYRRYRLAGPYVRSMFSKLAWVGAQDQTIAERFIELGARPDRVAVTGTMKYDTARIADRVEGQEELARTLGIRPDRPLWVAGQTGPGEEEVVMAAFKRLREKLPNLQLAIIPRKPERFGEAGAVIEKHGFRCVRRGRHPDGIAADPDDANVILGDTMGELLKFYALASATFVGRTIAPLGGSDVLEVAGLAKPIVIGPSYYNFQQPVEALLAGKAIAILPDRPGHLAEELAARIGDLLTDPVKAGRGGRAARRIVIDNQGATARTVDGIAQVLK